MMENRKDIETLVADYLAGEADAVEMKAVEAWLAESPENRELFQKVSAYWNAEVTSAADTSRGYVLLEKKLSSNRLRFSRAVGYAAGLAAALVIGISAGMMMSGRSGHITAYVTGDSISSFVLSDGTRVKLNKNSTLRVANGYDRRSRNVELDGEAYFEVVHDPAKRFNLKMGEVDVTVLGTEFNAVNKADEGFVSTSLVRGSVLFSTPSQKIRLFPGRMARYDVGRDEVEFSAFDKDSTTAWTENLIRYKSADIRDLIQRLADEKGVTVLFRGDVFSGEGPVSGTLEASVPFEQMLSVLQVQVGFVWERSGNGYVIYRSNAECF